ncbi:MAG: complex I NDUFA9 subunit family protein [Gammaproteobacteria bacterium]|nr:complex I NDUFA9 subunit family protein [Gammaproteobacteria bacterium]
MIDRDVNLTRSTAGVGRTVCVLGGTGFVGSRLVAHLAAQGYAIRVPSRNTLASALRVLPDLRLFTADVHDPATLRDCVAGCDFVVNCIGILNEPGTDGSGFIRAHVELVDKLLAAARETGVGKLVQVSALQADAARGPSHYLRSKGQAEGLIAQNVGEMRWTILQPSVIFGPGDSFLNRFAQMARLLPFLPLAKPGAQFAPVHVDDVVAAISLALTQPQTDGQTYQLCGPEVYSLRALVRRAARAVDSRCIVIGIPDWMARIQGLVMERLPGKLFTTDNYRSLSVPSVCSKDGFAALGLEPRSLELNLAACLAPP